MPLYFTNSDLAGQFFEIVISISIKTNRAWFSRLHQHQNKFVDRIICCTAFILIVTHGRRKRKYLSECLTFSSAVPTSHASTAPTSLPSIVLTRLWGAPRSAASGQPWRTQPPPRRTSWFPWSRTLCLVRFSRSRTLLYKWSRRRQKSFSLLFIYFLLFFCLFLLFFHSFLLFPSSHATASFCQSTCQQSSGLYCQFQSKLNEQIFITQFCKKKNFLELFSLFFVVPEQWCQNIKKFLMKMAPLYILFCRKRDLAFDNHLIKYDNREEGSI